MPKTLRKWLCIVIYNLVIISYSRFLRVNHICCLLQNPHSGALLDHSVNPFFISRSNHCDYASVNNVFTYTNLSEYNTRTVKIRERFESIMQPELDIA